MLAIAVAQRARPVPAEPSRGSAQARLAPHREQIQAWLEPEDGGRGLRLSKIQQLLVRKGVDVPYSSLQMIAGAFSFGEDTLVFYTNRTFTDQVAGFGSGTKHKVGRKMMLGEIEKLFQSVRASFEAG